MRIAQLTLPTPAGGRVLIWLFALLGLLWLALQQPIKNDLSGFLPKAATDNERLLVDALRHSSTSQILLITLEAESSQASASASRALRRTLLDSGLFLEVNNGSGTRGADAINPGLFKYRYLIGTHAASQPDRLFAEASLRSELALRLRELHSPLPSPFKAYLPRDPVAAYQKMIDAWLPDERPEKRHGVWFSQDQRRALLVAQTHAAGLSIDEQQRVVDSVSNAVAALRGDDGDLKNLKLQMSGAGYLSVEARRITKHDTQQLSLIASLVVVGLLLLAYRSVRVTVLAGLPLISGLIAATALTGWLFGGIHGITLAFGITLLGVSIDYPIHLFSHLHARQPAARSMQQIWPTLRLGVLTTSVAYLVLVISDFDGLRQLGVFTLVGLIVAATTTRYVLPGLVSPRMQAVVPGWLTRIAELRLPRRPLLIVILTGSALSLLLLGTQHERLWQNDLSALNPLPAELNAFDRALRRELKVPEVNQLLVAGTASPELALQLAEQLAGPLRDMQEHGWIAGFDTPADFLPSAARQKQRQAQLPDPASLQQRLTDAMQNLPFKAQAFQGFLDDVENSRHLAPLTPADLPDGLLKQRLATMIRQQDERWLLLIPLSDVRQPELLRAQLPEKVRFIELRQETSALVGRYRSEIIKQLGWGLIAMFVVLSIGLRAASGRDGTPIHPWRDAMIASAKSLAPVLIGLLLTAAVLHLSGRPLTLFHLIALMLVLGIGIDYSLFFRHARESERNYPAVSMAQPSASAQVLLALLVCVASSVSVFAILGSSTLAVLSAIGETVATGGVLVFVTAFLLQSATTR